MAELMALLSGLLFALRARPGAQPDPRRAAAVLRDGLRAAPAGAARALPGSLGWQGQGEDGCP